MENEIWIATTNLGKLKEYERLFENKGFTLKNLKDLTAYSAPPETGLTFLENARIKAKAFHAVKPGQWVLAEDSGLVVEELGGLPGIHSARYAGNNARDVENYLKVVKMLSLKGAVHRSATFVCTIVAFDPNGTEHVFTGEVKGKISKEARGSAGFGYDPIFIPDGANGKTFAELSTEEKNQISHRALAVAEMARLIAEREIQLVRP